MRSTRQLAIELTPKCKAYDFAVGSAFEEAGLDPVEFRVLSHIARYADQIYSESSKTIAERCEITEEEAHTAIHALTEKGFLC